MTFYVLIDDLSQIIFALSNEVGIQAHFFLIGISSIPVPFLEYVFSLLDCFGTFVGCIMSMSISNWDTIVLQDATIGENYVKGTGHHLCYFFQLHCEYTIISK